jgi:gluconate:H+ symporter, GntP family
MNFSEFSNPAVAGPFFILLLSVVFIVVSIVRFKLHPFFALLFSALVVGLGGLWLKPGSGTVVALLDQVMREFGASAGTIGFSIAAAVVIGAAMMESGSADRIVRSAVATVGEKRAPYAVLGCSFILGIPVFFDTVFFLMIPLVRALALRTGKNYVLLLLAIAAGGVATHANVPPTPGPLVVAEMLKLDLGVAILGGIVLSIVPALGALGVAGWLDRRKPIPVRPVGAAGLEAERAMASRPDHTLPGLFVSLLPLALPVILIAGSTIATMFAKSLPPLVFSLLTIIGHKSTALAVSALVAVAVYLRQKKLRWNQADPVVGEPLATAGVIILITAAGGAYGAMIRAGGIGDAVRALFAGSSINYVLLAWVLAAVVRVAQGSATVAMITAAGIMSSLVPVTGYGVHPIYIMLAIGFGASTSSWMNDSGFWIFSRMSGLTQAETLRTWTVTLTAIAVFGLIELLIISSILPFAG